jgi:hypothetical protein
LLISFAIASLIAFSTSFLFFSTAGAKNGCGRVPIFAIYFASDQAADRNKSSFVYALVRLLRLPSEVFNKAHRPVRLVLGSPISVEQQQQYLATHTLGEYGHWLREKVYGASLS